MCQVLCSAVVSARKPWGREPTMDYDVMSDMEWEDEPEGESLSVRLCSCCDS